MTTKKTTDTVLPTVTISSLIDYLFNEDPIGGLWVIKVNNLPMRLMNFKEVYGSRQEAIASLEARLSGLIATCGLVHRRSKHTHDYWNLYPENKIYGAIWKLLDSKRCLTPKKLKALLIKNKIIKVNKILSAEINGSDKTN